MLKLDKKNSLAIVMLIIMILPLSVSAVDPDPAASPAVSTSVSASASTDTEVVDFITPDLNVDIPGLKFSNVLLKDDKIVVSFIGDYVTAAYRYLIGISVVIAIVMIMIGGLQYVLASGGTDTGKAKKRIKDAVTGVVLLFSVYTILYVVNPELIFFDALVVDQIHVHDMPPPWPAPPPPKKYPKGQPCRGKQPSVDATSITGGTFNTELDNYGCNRDFKKVKYIVLHEGARTAKQTIAVLKKRGLSTHYVIGRDGEVIQTMGIEKTAYHAAGINSYSIGIDLANSCGASYEIVKSREKSSKCTWTDEQYKSLNILLRTLTSFTNVPFDDDHIIGHCAIGHADPRNLDWNRIGLTQEKHRKDIVTGPCVKFDWDKMKAELKKPTG